MYFQLQRCPALEIIGLNSNVIDLCFRNNISRIEGASFNDIENDLRINKEYSMKVSDGIGKGGLLKFTADGEYHDYNPDVVKVTLQECVTTGEYADYKKFSNLVNSRDPSFLRDLFNLKKKKAISISEVESSKVYLKDLIQLECPLVLYLRKHMKLWQLL